MMIATEQPKFIKGNIVRIAKKISNSDILRTNRYAIVLLSFRNPGTEMYEHLFTDTNVLYQLIFEDGEENRWYREEDLTFIEKNGIHLLVKAKKIKFKKTKIW